MVAEKLSRTLGLPCGETDSFTHAHVGREGGGLLTT